MRAAIKRAVLRGHIDVRCSALQAPATALPGGLNLPLLRSYLAAFRKAAPRKASMRSRI
jgi:hypothetical protein